MESKPSAIDAAAALLDAQDARARLAQGLVTPSWFFASLALAIAVQIATTAIGVAQDEPWVLVGGAVAFLLVAGVQLARFRAVNGVWLGGLASRVVLGTATSASIVYVAALGVAIWAAYRDLAWLVVVSATLGGGGYAAAGRRWLTRYRAWPSDHARGESAALLVAAALVALAGLAVLVVNR